MVNVVNLLASPVGAPDGLWATILNWIEGSIVNYGWVIILFTLLIKACLIPLDFLMKFSTKKQTLVQQKLAPQIARINQKIYKMFIAFSYSLRKYALETSAEI